MTNDNYSSVYLVATHLFDSSSRSPSRYALNPDTNIGFYPYGRCSVLFARRWLRWTSSRIKRAISITHCNNSYKGNKRQHFIERLDESSLA